ncbi:hypothetical protein PSP6_260044 [Paraburkholderia tropica]|nr:hypothetical protein PSP6_260044 [Paraburkholderia tropica]
MRPPLTKHFIHYACGKLCGRFNGLRALRLLSGPYLMGDLRRSGKRLPTMADVQPIVWRALPR